MDNYEEIWGVRKKHIIMLAFGIALTIYDKDVLEGLNTWFWGSWVVSAIAAAISGGSGNGRAPLVIRLLFELVALPASTAFHWLYATRWFVRTSSRIRLGLPPTGRKAR